jgi:dolichol kinase
MVFLSSDYGKELLRKTIHLSSLWMPGLYYCVSREVMLWVLGMVTLLVVMLDVLRLYVPLLRHVLHGLLGKVMRAHELERGISGASYMLIGALLAVLLFSKPVAVTALLVLMVADTAASLVGKRFGKRPLLGKTMEGALGFVVAGWLMVGVSSWLFQQPLSFAGAGVIAVIVGAVVEILSGKCHIDDNLTIPLSVGAVMAAMLNFINHVI